MKYSTVHHFADDASLNFSSSIKVINKQFNYTLKLIVWHIQQTVGMEMKIWWQYEQVLSNYKMCKLFSIYTMNIKNDYCACMFYSILCKDHNVIPAAFRSSRNSILLFTVNQLKLDSEIRNAESYSFLSKLVVSFMRFMIHQHSTYKWIKQCKQHYYSSEAKNLLNVILYGDKNFDSNGNQNTLTATINSFRYTKWFRWKTFLSNSVNNPR